MADAHDLAAGIALGVLATLAATKALGKDDSKEPEHNQADLRVLRAKLYGMTPEQLDKFDFHGQTGYVPQSRKAILETFAGLTRPSRADTLKQIAENKEND